MTDKTARVTAKWDSDGDIWIATSEDIRGLVISARSEDELINKIRMVGSALLLENEGSITYDSFAIDYVRRDVVRELQVA